MKLSPEETDRMHQIQGTMSEPRLLQLIAAEQVRQTQILKDMQEDAAALNEEWRDYLRSKGH